MLARMVACLTAIGKGKTLNRAFLSTVKQWVRKNGSSIQKKSIGTCIRRLTIKTSVSLASSLGSAILAYRKVCQKGAGRVGA